MNVYRWLGISLITESEIDFVVDPAEGKYTSFYKCPLVFDFFTQSDHCLFVFFFNSYWSLEIWCFICVEVTTKGISEREAYGQANTERNSM